MPVFIHDDHISEVAGCYLWMVGQVGKNMKFYFQKIGKSLFIDRRSKNRCVDYYQPLIIITLNINLFTWSTLCQCTDLANQWAEGITQFLGFNGGSCMEDPVRTEVAKL